MIRTIRFIIFASLLVTFIVYPQSKTLVSIDSYVTLIDESTPCDLTLWGNKLENSCKCSLVKRYPAIKSGTLSAHDAVAQAIKKGRCSAGIIDSFLKQYVSPNASFTKATKETEKLLRQLVDAIASKSIVIKHVSPKGIVFDASGNFTPESLKQFLVKAYSEKKLSDPAFAKSECLEIRDLIEDKGYNTLQLFIIKYTCGDKQQEFILKEMASELDEVIKLAQASAIKQLAPYILPAREQDYPAIALPIAYISYEYAGKKHYLSLMPRADGVQLSYLMNLFKKKPNQETRNLVAQAYYAVGRSMAFLQKKFMKQPQPPLTVIGRGIAHGDFHKYNIFFDAKTSHVTWIDNERLADSFTNDRSPMGDFTYLLYYSLDPRLTPVDFMRSFDATGWLSLTVYNTIKGYLSAFDDNKRSQVLSDIEKSFKVPGLYSDVYTRYKPTIDGVFAQLASETN